MKARAFLISVLRRMGGWEPSQLRRIYRALGCHITSDTDAFDVAEALYAWGCFYNAGQGSIEYAAQSAVTLEGFDPGRCWKGTEEGYVAHDMLRELVLEFSPSAWEEAEVEA